MRSFPSAARQRLAAASVAGAVAVGVLTIPFPFAHADDDKDLKHRQRQVQGQIGDAAHDLDEASKGVVRATRKLAAARERLQSARADLDAVTERLGEARERNQQLRTELVAQKQELADADAALAEGQAAVEEQRERVRSTVVTNYAQGDPRLRAWGSLVSAGSIEDITRARAAEDVVVGHGEQVFDNLTDAEDELDAEQQRVSEATDALAEKQDEAADHVEVVRRLFSEARAAKAQVRVLVDDSRAARQKATAARAADRRKLAALRQRERAIKQRILRLAARDKSPGYTGSSDGFLSYPADGPVTSPYGYRVHPIYGYYSLHNGTDFGVPCGTPLKAVANGTVIDEYYDSVYGNRLYLSLGNVNGHNMTVIYNHMTGYRAAEGQRVSRGQIVGTSGTTGWSTGCHLHFTVMIDGNTVDPMKYL